MTNAICIDYGAIETALGNRVKTFSALAAGTSGIVPGPGFGLPVPFAPFAEQRCRDLGWCVKHLAADAGLAGVDANRTLFVFSAAKGDIRALDEPENTALPSPLLDDQAELAKATLGLDKCKSIVISNACASGAIALETAIDLMRAGYFDRSIVVAFDSLSRFVATGFASLGALSADCARPFDRSRSGLTLGDGAALAVLANRAPRAGDTVVAGAGSTNDANHRTGPSRTGDGLKAAADAALADAALAPAAIGAVKCHGTATPYNDAMEAKALFSLFGAAIPPCVSFKGALGHTSGASSLVEVIVAASCLQAKMLPPTAGFATPGVDENIPVSNGVQPIERQKPAMLCLSAGFGGVNAAIVVTEWA
jgi:3-oxoacyl-[acyl-carrier-protein] synthase-1